MQSVLRRKSFLGAAIGTMIEYYDFVLLSIFLPVIAPLFFGGETPYESLVIGYMSLMLAMLARPLGGAVFGHLGDRYGRRKALLASLYGIAFSTFLMGLVPTTAMIGFWAGIFITFAKSMQMLCFGGEYNGAGIYVVELADKRSEGLVGSLLTATTLLGALMASLVGVVCTMSFMPAWSWRAAFMLGGLVGVFGIFYRKNLIETPQFIQADRKKHTFPKLLNRYRVEMLAGFFVGGFATMPFTTALTFINPILMTDGFFTPHQLMVLQSVLVVVAIIGIVTSGKMADIHSPLKVMRSGCFLLLAMAYPLMLMVDQAETAWIVSAEIILILVNQALLGPSNAYLKSIFIPEYRYRASSFSFCMGLAVIGGLTPVMEALLYRLSGSFMAISFWLIFISGGTLLAFRAVEKKQMNRILFPPGFEPERFESGV